MSTFRTRTLRARKVFSLIVSAALLLMFASPGVAVLANETSSTPEPVVLEDPADPGESAPVEVVVPDQTPEAIDPPAETTGPPEVPAVVVEQDPAEEAQSPEGDLRSEESVPVTVPVKGDSAKPATGPRSDFPPPTTIGDGCDLTTIAIFWAGQNYDAGTVSVHNDEDTLYVTFETTDGWTMSLTHLYVGLVPPASYAPGSFPYQTAHQPPVTSYTYEIPLASLGAQPGDTIYVAAHAEVANGEQNETAWAGVGQWPGLLFTHVIQECSEPTPSAITIVKFNDLDEDGVLDDGEPFIEGVDITIEGDEFADSAVTDVNGEVVFGDLTPGAYLIGEVLPDGWFATVDLPLEVIVSEGQDQTVYIGNAEEPLPFTDIDLAIAKQADVETAAAGDEITYTLTYENVGSTDATGFVITDDFDETLVEVTDAAGGTIADGTITWSIPGPLGPEDGEQTIVYTVRVLSPIPDGVTAIDNYVLISHPDDDNPKNDDAEDTVGIEPFLPFTPEPEPEPEPSAPETVTPVETTGEPYLPYTGGTLQTLVALALSSLLIGLALRREASRT